MLVSRAGNRKMLIRIANKEDPDLTAALKKQSDLGLCCLSRPTCVQNFRTFTVV